MAEEQARAVRQPRHDDGGAERGRAPVHPGLDHQGPPALDGRSARSRSCGRSWPTARACSASCAPACARCARPRRSSPTRSRSARRRCAAPSRSTAGSSRCCASCRRSPRTRRCSSASTARPTSSATLNPTLQYLAPAQLQCNYVTLWFRNVSSLLSEGDTERHLAAVHHHRDAAGPQQRGRPVLRARQRPDASRTTCTPTRTRTPPRPGQPKECEAGNERTPAARP